MAEFGPPPLITRDELVAVLERNFPEHWINLLLADPSNLSVFEGAIAALLRVQDAVDENFSVGSFVLTAPGRTPASSTVRLSRPSGAAVTIDALTRFLDGRGALWYPSAAFDVAASAGAQVVDVPIRTDRAGHYLNSFEPLTYFALDALPDPAFVVVAGTDPAAGGATPFLEQHGKERRVFRAASETDDQYRNRIRFLEDQVSPQALADTIVEVLDSFNATKFVADLVVNHGLRPFREPFRDSAQHAGRGVTGLDKAFFDALVFWDDANGSDLRAIWDTCAWFDVLLPTPIAPDETRRFYDDSDATFGTFFDDPEFAYFDVPTPESIAAPIAALVDELDRRRAGCVRFRVIMGEDLPLVRHPRQNELDSAGDWTDQDGAATDLEMITAVASMDGDGTYAFSATGTGPGAPAAAGDLLFSLADVPDPVSVSHAVLRAWVRRESVAAGVDPVFQFLIRPPTAGAANRVGSTTTVSDDDWLYVEHVLDENPLTAAPWAIGDVAGAFRFGCANVAAVGATEQLLVSELSLELVVSYG